MRRSFSQLLRGEAHAFEREDPEVGSAKRGRGVSGAGAGPATAREGGGPAGAVTFL